MPRKPTTSPAFLKGVSIKPSLKVPHPASTPRKLSRVASVPSTPSSIGTTDSTCQIAFIPPPRDLPPLKPIYELPTSISPRFTRPEFPLFDVAGRAFAAPVLLSVVRDRKSTRLNSSHLGISYAVFCLKKKKNKKKFQVLKRIDMEIADRAEVKVTVTGIQ